ncbi:hypothetical protein EDC96DRAFT_503654 [Choanephora cucurbitarum]|nr:hypothetical protein EDC96DRAFT_503654 [Choanephora cucurbitarum]
MNLSNAYISNVKSFVCLYSRLTVVQERQPHNHDGCIQVNNTVSTNKTVELSAKDHDNQVHTWQIDTCAKEAELLDMDKEKEEMIDLLFEGHDVAIMFMHISGSHVMFNKKSIQKKDILKELEERLSTIEARIEFCYFGFTDGYSYDLKQEVLCSNDLVINQGIDHWMTPANTVSEIWDMVSKGCKLPSVLKINLYHKSSKRKSSLYLFDVLQPALIASASEAKNMDAIYYSFHRLCTLVDSCIDIGPAIPVVTDYYVLTFLVSKFICGQGKFILIAHMNQCLRVHRSETILALDLLEKLRKIKTISLANMPLSESKEPHHHKKDYKAKYKQAKKVIYKKESVILELQSDNERLNNRINANHFEMSEIKQQSEHALKDYQMRAYKTLHHMTQIQLKREEKLKKLAFFRISFLKAEKKCLDMKMNQLQQERKNDKERINQLRMKGNRLAIHFKAVKKQLVNEINGLRKEKKEFRELFVELKNDMMHS